MHNGFKCLDVLSGRVYISLDVTFDKSIFPFATLHSMLVPVFALIFPFFLLTFFILLMIKGENL